MTNQIANYDTYNTRMAKPLMDKLFFVDKVDANLIVDYGCADGLLIQHLCNWYPDGTEFIGFDNDLKMVDLAKKRFPEYCNAYFTDNWNSVINAVIEAKNRGKKTALNLSSVIHEVYSYGDVEAIGGFWQRVFCGNFDYIIIRDMMPNRTVDRAADINDIAKVYRKFLHRKELRDFETRWGSVESNKNLVHFLLKYTYTQPNWEREVKENYIPLYREDLLAMLPDAYAIGYHEHYVLPWLKRGVKNDFGIELKDPTHIKIILEKQ